MTLYLSQHLKHNQSPSANCVSLSRCLWYHSIHLTYSLIRSWPSCSGHQHHICIIHLCLTALEHYTFRKCTCKNGCHMSVSHIRATIILERPSMRWTFSLILVLHKYMYRLLILSMILYWVLWYKIIIIMILMLAVALVVVCMKLCYIIYTCACDIYMPCSHPVHP